MQSCDKVNLLHMVNFIIQKSLPQKIWTLWTNLKSGEEKYKPVLATCISFISDSTSDPTQGLGATY
jgi:hypothetical protein